MMIRFLWQNPRTQRYYYLRLSEDNQYADMGSAYLATGGPHLHPAEIIRLLATGNGQNKWAREITGPEAGKRAASFISARRKSGNRRLITLNINE